MFSFRLTHAVCMFFLAFVICINIRCFFCIQLDPLFHILCTQKENECIPGRNDTLWIHICNIETKVRDVFDCYISITRVNSSWCVARNVQCRSTSFVAKTCSSVQSCILTVFKFSLVMWFIQAKTKRTTFLPVFICPLAVRWAVCTDTLRNVFV